MHRCEKYRYSYPKVPEPRPVPGGGRGAAAGARVPRGPAAARRHRHRARARPGDRGLALRRMKCTSQLLQLELFCRIDQFSDFLKQGRPGRSLNHVRARRKGEGLDSFIVVRRSQEGAEVAGFDQL